MSYMMRYKGKYELRVELDESINDFARNEKGAFVDNDIYIDCDCGRIYHVGGSILEAWIGDVKNKTSKTATYNSIIKQFDKIIEPDYRISGDGEGSFRFNSKYIDVFAKRMGAKTRSKNRSPFSSKWLPKKDYSIPKADTDRLKEATKPIIDNKKIYLITRAYNQLANELKIDDFSNVLKKEMLNAKQYFHSTGNWDKLIDTINKVYKESKKG